MRYGQKPVTIDCYSVDCKEMMFYQDMPIKMANDYEVSFEERLRCFSGIIFVACQDFIDSFGYERYMSSYVYVSAKNLFQPKDCSYNRPGWHCDGFMTDDINYIWSDKFPTVFNLGDFKLTQDDRLSIEEMQQQADDKNNVDYGNGMMVRLDQYNVHKVADVTQSGMRCFLKVTISDRKYDLIGNSHNYQFNYKWDMRKRNINRNVPQLL